MEVDMNKIRILAESAERRAKELHKEFDDARRERRDWRGCNGR